MTIERTPLGTGPPTRDEIRVYYPPQFTWWQLRLFINSGDLGLLKRNKKLQQRYQEWGKGIQAQYGSIVGYLLNYRLQWGKLDRLALVPSSLSENEQPGADTLFNGVGNPMPEPEYFTADIHLSLVSIIQNDWPYSVPLDVEHSLIWTKVPILPAPSLLMPHIAASLPQHLHEKVSARLAQDGLWGFTGATEPPPDPSLLPDNLGALSEWGVTMETLTISPKGSPEEEEAVRKSGEEVQKFIKRKWVEREWETAWFVNPPRLQSVPGLAHVHVFARRKSPEEIEEWDRLDN